MSLKKSTVLILCIFLLGVIISCAPPGAQPLDQIDSQVKETKQTEDSKTETTEETKEEQEATKEKVEEEKEESKEEEKTEEEPKEATEIKEKSTVCVEGTFKCKDTKLIECRSGKLIKKEDCGSRGCYVDHCGECDPDTPLECQGNKLVKCTKDARKKVTNCYECSNNACVDPPEVPEPLMCNKVLDMTAEDSSPLRIFSAFKKSEVDQELGAFNHAEDNGNELGRMFANGAFDDVKSNKGKSPVYVQIERCYIYCQMDYELEFEIQCEDKTVTAKIPPHSASASKPLRFFIGEDGSTFYGDSDRNGQGELFTDPEKIYKKDNIAIKGSY